jgi:hypothetical protein
MLVMSGIYRPQVDTACDRYFEFHKIEFRYLRFKSTALSPRILSHEKKIPLSGARLN